MVLSMRFFSPMMKRSDKITGRMGKSDKQMHEIKRKTIKTALMNTPARGNNKFMIQPPSKGDTGIRLKSARVRFSCGKMPKKYIARLNAGPKKNMIRAWLLEGMVLRDKTQPVGSRRKEETFSFRSRLIVRWAASWRKMKK